MFHLWLLGVNSFALGHSGNDQGNWDQTCNYDVWSLCSDRFISAMFYSTFKLLEVQSHGVVLRLRCGASTVAVTLNVTVKLLHFY